MKKQTLKDYVQKFNELSTIFDNMPTGVFVILDQNSKIASINKTAGQILNLDHEALVGKDAKEIFEERFPGIQKLINETIEHQRCIKNFTLEIENSEAEVKTYLVSTAIVEEIDPAEFGVVLVLHDVSEITRLRRTVISNQQFGDLVGSSPSIKDVYALIQTVAQYDTTVLIYGETGTGKELVARTIHSCSQRSNGPFIPVNCSALTPSLLESELFGHVKGAFTGAAKNRQGRFEFAEGGTIFLDEIATLSLDLQVKLLRTLQERVIERVGSSQPQPIDVRVISATNLSLPELVAKKQFREDFYYRLKVFQINLPALRERRTDIPLLAGSFILRFNRLYGKSILGLSHAAKEMLINYYWPGNVRELENAIEHAIILANSKIIEPQCFPPEIRHSKTNGTPPPPSPEIYPAAEEENLRRALSAFGGNVTRASQSLGMHRSTLWRKMRCYDIHCSEF